MKLKIALSLIVILSAALTVAAQQQDAGAPPPQQAAAAPTETVKPELQPVDLVITEKEVVAVQSALKRHGYYRAKANGILDRETRDALRSYQRDNNLQTSGKIDRPTLNSLKLNYPATGNEGDSSRRNGAVSKVVYGVKDGAVATTRAVTGTSRKVVGATKTGYEKTTAAPGKAYDKTKDVVAGTGNSAAGGMKSAGKKVTGATQRASDAIVGRSDADIHSDVRAVLDVDPQTRAWVSQVKEGQVTISLVSGQDANLGNVIARIRSISGVKAVMVAYQ
jgi:peptidoglycan hydrolase-like protein with peptidoglycan-binding domain